MSVPAHSCFTVAYLGWAGIENGERLTRGASEGFDALLTKDANVGYEHNLVNMPIAVVILRAPSNDIDDIRPLLPALLKALTALPPRQITHIPKAP